MSTGIQWTDETWNPVVGCDRVSPGCAHCYAKELHDKRNKAYWAGKKVAPQYAQPFETVQLMPSRLMEPLRWRKPRKVFVNSVADLFHNDVPNEFIATVFAVMAAAPQHTFQILTKRPQRMLDWFTWFPTHYNGPRRDGRPWDSAKLERALEAAGETEWPLPNVWLGVSVENQRWADERLPLLLQTPAAVRFLSCEPLLGPLDLTWWDGCEPTWADPRIDWVIVGGESGKGARPCNVHWIADLLAQCCFSGTPAFVKQLGALPGFRLEDEEARGNPMPGFHHYDAPSGLFIKKLRDSHGGDPAEWPEELRMREFPASGVRA